MVSLRGIYNCEHYYGRIEQGGAYEIDGVKRGRYLMEFDAINEDEERRCAERKIWVR